MKRVIVEITTGFVMASVISAFAISGLIPQGLLIVLNLAIGVSTIELFQSMPMWSTMYIIGWILGAWMMLNSGLLGFWEIAAYIVGPSIALFARFQKQTGFF